LPTTITVNKSGKQIIKVPLRHQLNKTSELKTLTRTINIHQPNGSVQTYSQVAVLSRPVTEDRVTGQKSYGAWNTAHWSKFVVPTLTGYIPSSANVAAKAVTSASKNERIDIYYKKAK
ncbi:MAG: mucin-binding protein, partial [Bombilactobacillus sp.]